MNLDRLEFKLRTVTKTPLHIGSGELSTQPKSGGSDETGSVQTVVRGAGNKPLIPGATLKGWLRSQHLTRVGGDLNDPVFCENFGQIGHRSKGHVSRLTLHDALATAFAPIPTGRKACEDKFCFTAPHNAIDRLTGAVDGNRLFMREYVPAETEFELCGSYRLESLPAEDSSDEQQAVCNSLAEVLAPLGQSYQLGAGSTSDLGQMQQIEVISIKRIRFDPRIGRFTEENIDPITLAKPLANKALNWDVLSQQVVAEWSCRLDSDEPFIVAKPDVSDPRETTRIQPLQTADGKPVLPVSSLRGVLRAEAQWALELAALNDAADELQVPTDRRGAPKQTDQRLSRPNNAGLDDRFLDHALARHAVTTAEDLTALTSVERLFGVPGWKGLVAISEPIPTRPSYTVTMHNIAIDRLTMGALTGAKWETDVFMGAGFRFSLKLTISKQRFDVWSKFEQADVAFLRSFLNEILPKTGLCLGGHSSVGYGEFSVQTDEVTAEVTNA